MTARAEVDGKKLACKDGKTWKPAPLAEQLKHLKRGTPIWIQWLDTMSADGWTTTRRFDARDHDQQSKYWTIGFFLTVTRESVVVATCRKVQELRGGHLQYSGEWAIPLGTVKKWGTLYVEKPGKELTTTLTRLEAFYESRPGPEGAQSDEAASEAVLLEAFIEAEKRRTR